MKSPTKGQVLFLENRDKYPQTEDFLHHSRGFSSCLPRKGNHNSSFNCFEGIWPFFFFTWEYNRTNILSPKLLPLPTFLWEVGGFQGWSSLIRQSNVGKLPPVLASVHEATRFRSSKLCLAGASSVPWACTSHLWALYLPTDKKVTVREKNEKRMTFSRWRCKRHAQSFWRLQTLLSVNL